MTPNSASDPVDAATRGREEATVAPGRGDEAAAPSRRGNEAAAPSRCGNEAAAPSRRGGSGEASSVSDDVLVLAPDALGAPGGIARYHEDLLEALGVVPGVRSVVSLPRNAGDGRAAPGPRVTERPAVAGALRYAWAAHRLARRLRPRIVVCGHVHLAPLARRLATVSGAFTLCAAYGVEVWTLPGLRLRKALRAMDAVFCISRMTRARVEALTAFPAHRLPILPNPLPPLAPEPGEAAVRAFRSRHGLGERPFLLTVARMAAAETYKGHERLLAAFAGLAGERPELDWVVVGAGEGRSALAARVRALGLETRVHFLGAIAEAEKPLAYRAARLFVMPSTGEGFGYVFTEAMAHGLPAIGGARDGSLDALLEGRAGRAIDPGVPGALKQALREALAEPPRRDPRVVEVFARTRFQRRVAALLARGLEDRA